MPRAYGYYEPHPYWDPTRPFEALTNAFRISSIPFMMLYAKYGKDGDRQKQALLMAKTDALRQAVDPFLHEALHLEEYSTMRTRCDDDPFDHFKAEFNAARRMKTALNNIWLVARGTEDGLLWACRTEEAANHRAKIQAFITKGLKILALVDEADKYIHGELSDDGNEPTLPNCISQ